LKKLLEGSEKEILSLLGIKFKSIRAQNFELLEVKERKDIRIMRFGR